MKKTVFVFGLLLTVAACASDPVPQHIQAKVDAMPIEQVPHNFFLERDTCGSKRNKEKIACREEVRREYYARQLAREERNTQ